MDVATIVQTVCIWALPLIFAVTLHEAAHGFVALWCGDYTAKLAGRLSLNPINHIDMVGTVIVPLLMLVITNFNFMFGWAKPVPVDPRNLRHPRRDMALVAFAGPLSNFVMALLWGLIAKAGLMLGNSGNLWFGVPLSKMGIAGIQINIILAVLNLIPLPPLDGGKVLTSLLPPKLAYKLSLIEPYSFFILVILLVTGVLGWLILPAFVFLQYGIMQLLGL